MQLTSFHCEGVGSKDSISESSQFDKICGEKNAERVVDKALGDIRDAPAQDCAYAVYAGASHFY